jgi:hypothetical protein
MSKIEDFNRPVKMTALYRYTIDSLAKAWKVKSDDPLRIDVTLFNFCGAIFTDWGKYWDIFCQGKSFVVKVPGTSGLRLGLMQALTVSEEIKEVRDALLKAGYKIMDPLYSEWLVFYSPNAHFVSISPMTVNSDPRGLWGVYSHNDVERRFVREVCMDVRGCDNVI